MESAGSWSFRVAPGRSGGPILYRNGVGSSVQPRGWGRAVWTDLIV